MANRDLDRKRAEFAYNCVKKFVEKNDEDKQKKYRGYIRNTPTMILNNGFGGTLAFIFSKRFKSDGDVYIYISKNIYNWFNKEENRYLLKLKNGKNINDLEELINILLEDLNLSEYRMATNEILTLFVWLKRFVDGMIEGEDNNG